MPREIKAFMILIVFIGFAAIACSALVFVLSGGNVADFVQTELIRLSLSSRQDELNRPMGTDDAPIRFTVNQGDTPRIIAANLLNTQLIHDDGLFVDYVRVEGLDTELEAGTYFFKQTQSIPEIALALTDSRSSQITFRILEGWRIEEVALAIDNNGLFSFSGNEFLAVSGPGVVFNTAFVEQVGLPIGASLEGFLFPETYQLPPDIDATDLRDALLDTFLNVTGQQLINDAAQQGYTLFQMVTLASIIEREAVWDDEKPMISSVYRNRLDIGMNLDADPTVQYGLNGTRDGAWWPNITQADYRNVQSPYNTYLYNGLPPGPIASPGLAAIRAAVYPAESEFYYFRAACDESNYHNFATTFEEHVANGCQN